MNVLNLRMTVQHLNDATITAPMSGTVIGTPLKAGQTISTGISTQMIIATIADLSDLEIYLNCRRNRYWQY